MAQNLRPGLKNVCRPQDWVAYLEKDNPQNRAPGSTSGEET